MENPFRYASQKTTTALVIAFPPAMRGLFNPEVHALVRDVAEQLEGVYVTYVLSSGFGPSLRDAMAAARFAGCDSAVVIPAGADNELRFMDPGTTGDWLLSAVPVPSELDASAVAEAYVMAVEETGRAA